MPIVGEQIAQLFETGVAGETFTVYDTLIDGVHTPWVLTIVDEGDGFYSYHYLPDAPGSYSWSAIGSASGRVTINFEVDRLDGVVVTLPAPGSGRVSLNRLVEQVALRSQDLVQAIATRDEVGTLTFTDVNNLIEDHAFYAGMELHLTNGPNLGLLRRIADSAYDTGTLSWEQPIYTPVTLGTTANIYNRAGLGHTYQEYKNAINMVIRELGTNAMTRVTVPLDIPASGSPSVELDGEVIAKVCRVSYTDAAGTTQSFRRNKRHGWWAQNGDSSLTFTGNALGIASSGNSPLLAHGYARATELERGIDTTFIDSEWLVETAAGLLQNANPDNAGNLAPGQYLRNRADAMRGKLATPFDANCVSVGGW